MRNGVKAFSVEVTTPQCLFMWRLRWSLLANVLSHRWHRKGLLPVCFLRCLVSSSDRANLQSHSGHEQLYGFSPVWVRLCAFRWELLV